MCRKKRYHLQFLSARQICTGTIWPNKGSPVALKTSTESAHHAAWLLSIQEFGYSPTAHFMTIPSFPKNSHYIHKNSHRIFLIPVTISRFLSLMAPLFREAFLYYYLVITMSLAELENLVWPYWSVIIQR